MKKYIKDYVMLTLLLSLFSIITGIGIPSFYDVNILPYYHSQFHLIFSMIAIMFLALGLVIVALFSKTLSSLIKLYTNESSGQNQPSSDCFVENLKATSDTTEPATSVVDESLMANEKRLFRPMIFVSRLIPIYFLLLALLVIMKNSIRY